MAQEVDEEKFDNEAEAQVQWRTEATEIDATLARLPWLAGDKRQQVEDANLLIEMSKEACKRAMRTKRAG